MESAMTLNEFRTFRSLIRELCGIDFGEDKLYLIENRLSGLVAEFGLYSYDELYLYISERRNEKLTEKFIDAVTTNETFWFRDRSLWNIFERVILPRLAAQMKTARGGKARIWSAACSTGQEPYSIAMSIDRWLEKSCTKGVTLSDFEILATDISGSSLKAACMARYDGISITRGLDEEYKSRYFRCAGRAWNLDARIRDSVTFEHFNLQHDFWRLGTFDVIFMRNVLIYFTDKLRREILEKTAALLRPGGFMFLGSSELLPEPGGKFTARQYDDGIYYQLEG